MRLPTFKSLPLKDAELGVRRPEDVEVTTGEALRDSEITENALCASYEISGMTHRSLTPRMGDEITGNQPRVRHIRPVTQKRAGMSDGALCSAMTGLKRTN